MVWTPITLQFLVNTFTLSLAPNHSHYNLHRQSTDSLSLYAQCGVIKRAQCGRQYMAFETVRRVNPPRKAVLSVFGPEEHYVLWIRQNDRKIIISAQQNDKRAGKHHQITCSRSTEVVEVSHIPDRPRDIGTPQQSERRV